jgi:hypothetical protein
MFSSLTAARLSLSLVPLRAAGSVANATDAYLCKDRRRSSWKIDDAKNTVE